MGSKKTSSDNFEWVNGGEHARGGVLLNGSYLKVVIILSNLESRTKENRPNEKAVILNITISC